MEKEIITEGAILRSSWGYDQTNIDFYKVVSVKNDWAWLVRIGQTVVENLPQYMGERVVADDSTQGKKFRRKIKNYGNSDYVAINSYAGASVWSGEPQLQTHTH